MSFVFSHQQEGRNCDIRSSRSNLKKDIFMLSWTFPVMTCKQFLFSSACECHKDTGLMSVIIINKKIEATLGVPFPSNVKNIASLVGENKLSTSVTHSIQTPSALSWCHLADDSEDSDLGFLWSCSSQSGVSSIVGVIIGRQLCHKAWAGSQAASFQWCHLSFHQAPKELRAFILHQMRLCFSILLKKKKKKVPMFLV